MIGSSFVGMGRVWILIKDRPIYLSEILICIQGLIYTSLIYLIFFFFCIVINQSGIVLHILSIRQVRNIVVHIIFSYVKLWVFLQFNFDAYYALNTLILRFQKQVFIYFFSGLFFLLRINTSPLSLLINVLGEFLSIYQCPLIQ